MHKALCILVVLSSLSLRAQLKDFGDIDFRKADSVARSYHGASLNNLPILASGLTSELETEVEQFRAIYYWVCHNVQSGYGLKEINDRNRYRLKDDFEALAAWDRQFKKDLIQRLLQDKVTLCSGYAFLLRQLSQLAGIQVVIINGYGTTPDMKIQDLQSPNHAWNAVLLNGKWYLCDATWSSGYIDLQAKRFVFDFEPAYFLMTADRFARDHQPEDKEWLLEEPEELQ